MAASNHINKDQLAMFMSGNDIMNYVNESFDRHAYGEERETMEHLWERKLDESQKSADRDPDLYQSLASGWKDNQKPIQIAHETVKGEPVRYLLNGHHRAAAAADLQKRRGQEIYFPVEHTDWGVS